MVGANMVEAAHHFGPTIPHKKNVFSLEARDPLTVEICERQRNAAPWFLPTVSNFARNDCQNGTWAC